MLAAARSASADLQRSPTGQLFNWNCEASRSVESGIDIIDEGIGNGKKIRILLAERASSESEAESSVSSIISSPFSSNFFFCGKIIVIEQRAEVTMIGLTLKRECERRMVSVPQIESMMEKDWDSGCFLMSFSILCRLSAIVGKSSEENLKSAW